VIRGLNLGCGSDFRPDTDDEAWINTDIIAPIPEIQPWDLENFPWPWLDGQFNRIDAIDVFEHISPRAVCGFMTECHRLLEIGGELRLQVPYWQQPNTAIDPTHYRGCHEQTFDYWCEGTKLHARHNAAYGGVSFMRLSFDHEGYDLCFRLGRLA
jgi:predicted SAM-dependent methyltransferase